jgi:tape measure domain-containing protein
VATIDERVVAMSFENQVFEQRAAQTMTTLGKLKEALASIGNAKGLDDIEKSANKVTLAAPMSALDKLKSKLGRGIDSKPIEDIEKSGAKVSLEQPNKAIDKTQAKLDHLSAGGTFDDIEKAAGHVTLDGLTKALSAAQGGFSRLEGIATVALGNITSQAVMKGGAFAKSFATEPIKQGLEEYQTNLNSIQTILANTADSGGNLKTVNSALQELNTYSDKTIYNFSEMARNIGTFTAAGVQLKPATSAIKGIANLAALSGSNSQQASTAMYQLSQAISSGRVGLQDWNSVVNAGMGGAVFQKALMRTAENMGALEKGAVKIDKATGKATVNGNSFRESIQAKPGQKSWLSSDVLTKTLSQFTGDLTDAQLAAQGFSADQIKAIQAQAKTAQAAATEVKTLPQVFDVAKETIGSGWSQTFQTIFGDFEESKKTFTELSNTINGFINANSNARNKVLGDWKALGGRTDLIEGIKAMFQALIAIVKPIKDAFRDIFPATTGKQLAEFTKDFRTFMENIKPSPTTIDNLRRTFDGLFAVVHIGWSIIKGLAGVIGDLLGIVGKGAGGFLNFTAGIGDFLRSVDDALTKGDALKGFFDGLSAVLKVPFNLIISLAKAIGNLFTGDSSNAADNFNNSIDAVNKRLGPFKSIIDTVGDGMHKLADLFSRAKQALEPWFSSMADKAKDFGDSVSQALGSLNFDQVMSGLQTGLMAGIFVTLKKAFAGGASGGLISSIKGTLGGVNEVLEATTGKLKAMEQEVKAKSLLEIALAVGVLAGGIFLLSKIDGKNLSKALSAVAVGLGELMGAMKLMTSGMGKFGALQLPVIAAGLIGLATAVVILAGAMKIFATMSWEDIVKGLVGVAGSLAAVGLGMKLMGGGPTLIAQGAGLILVGGALAIIAASLKIFASMDLKDTAKGIFSIVEALGGIALGLSMMPPNLPLTAAGLIIMGIALASIAGAVKSFGSMDFGTILKGLGAIIGAIVGIGLAVSLIPPTIGLTAAGLVIVGSALVIVAGAIATLGNLSIGTLVKGLAGMAGALIILAGGLTLMIATLPGSIALMAAAAAFAVLAPTMALLGKMSWETIFKGLGAMALALGTIGVVGLVAAPALAAIGIAMIPLGAGFILVATAAKIFAGAMALLSDTGQKGVAVFLTALTGFVALLPTIVINFIKGLVSIVEEVANLAPKIVVALGVVIDTIIAFVIESAPKLAIAAGVLIDSLLQVLLTNSPKLISAGYQLLSNLLSGLSQNIGQITDKAAQVITNFLNGLARNASKLVDSGVNMIRAFMNGISSRFGDLATTAGNMISRFAQAIEGQEGRMVTIAASLMLGFIGGIASYIPKLVDRAGSIITNFIAGVGANANKVVGKGADVIIKFIDGISSNMGRIANKGADAVINFLNGIASTIRNKGPELRAAGWNVATALLDGIWQGIDGLGQKVVDKLGALVRLLPDKVRKLLGIKSPSTVFADIGRNTMIGFSKGIDDNAEAPRKGAEKAGRETMRGMAKGVSDNQSLISEAAVGASSQMLSRVQGFLGIHSPSEVFRDIGMNVNRGFRDGLLGSREDVLNAFDSMNSSLIDKIRDLRSQVKDGTDKLGDLQQQYADKLTEIGRLRSEKKPDQQAIANAIKESQDLKKQIDEESAAVDQNGRALTRAREIRKSLTGSMKDEKNELLGLKDQYAVVSKQLEEASQALTSAQQARQSAQDRWASQYDNLPDVDKLVSDAMAQADMTYAEKQDALRKQQEEAQKKAKIDQVALYEQALQEQIVATAKYQATIQKLRELGLDDQTYQKLLDQGLAGQDFADALLRSGKTGVDKVNQLDAQLLQKSTDLAKQAADNLYNAGIQAAQGLVDGLTKKKSDLDKAMTALADTMVNAIKSKLKIKSPSQVFAEIGKFTTQGFARGLNDTADTVITAAGDLGDNAATALRSSLSSVLDTVGAEIDPTMTITPVLDLDQLRKDAGGIKDLGNVIPITAAASYGQASATSQEVSATQRSLADSVITQAPSLVFEQNNYSPEALSDVEIYRKTKNQLGQLKSVLGVPI